MASYTSPTLSGYNANPPPDDGSQTGDNEVKWSTIKEKLPDPLKTYAEAIDSATTTAFGTVDGQLLTDSNKYDEDTGAADAYVVTLSPAISSYLEGHMFRMKIGAGNTNTGACTVAVNGLAAQDIKTQAGDDPAANDLLAGGIYTFVYDGTNYQVQQQAKHVFVNLGTGEPAISTTQLQFLIGTLAEDTWEGVGPTGSGETNIWTALDGVPADVDWIECYIMFRVGNSGGNNAGASTHVRANGSTATFDDTTEIIRSAVLGDSTGDQSDVSTSVHAKIPVVSRVFDVSWHDQMLVGNPDAITLEFRLTGYGYN